MNKKPLSFLLLAIVSSYQATATPLTVTTLAPNTPSVTVTQPVAQPVVQATAQVAPPAVIDPLSQSGSTPSGSVSVPVTTVAAKPGSTTVPTPARAMPPASTSGLHITPIKPVHKKAKAVKAAKPEDDEVAPFFDIPEKRADAVSEENSPHDKHEKQPYEVTLPGLGKVSGDPRLMKAVVVPVNGDGTEVVQVSSQFQNRISTPFETPKIIDSSDTEFKISGSNIFLSTPSDNPVVVYITGSERNDPVISLTIVPKPIPAQTIILQLDPSIAVQSSPKGHHEHKPETYEQHLAGLLKTLASGDTPEGFTTGNISNIVGRKGVLIINPVARYSNAYLDIFVYQAQNAGASTINLSETSFYQKGVRAVGMYPLSTLRKADKTYVYVISDKTALGGAK